MTRGLEASPELERDNRTLCGKNAASRRSVEKKVAQLQEAPLHSKPLRAPLEGVGRFHVGVSFVPLFEPEEEHQIVRLLRFTHHDEAHGS